MQRASWVVAAFLVLFGVAAQAAYFDGMFAFDRGDYKTAVNEWTASARLGESKSLFGLGQLYEGGKGVAKDPVRAYVYYRLAAVRGFDRGESASAAVGRSLSPQDLARAQSALQKLQREGRYLVAAADLAAAPRLPAKRAPAPKAAPPAAVVRKPAAPAKPRVVQKLSPAAAAPAKVVVRQPTRRRLDLAWACRFEARWKDEGSGSIRDVSLFEPVAPGGYSVLGSYAQGNYYNPNACVLAVKDLGGAGPDLVVRPTGWQEVWRDSGSGARADGSIWRAVPPGNDYVCLGSVAQAGYRQPNSPSYGCIHRCLVTKLRPAGALWTDENTGASRPVGLFKLYASGGFAAVPSRDAPGELPDLNVFADCAFE